MLERCSTRVMRDFGISLHIEVFLLKRCAKHFHKNCFIFLGIHGPELIDPEYAESENTLYASSSIDWLVKFFVVHCF